MLSGLFAVRSIDLVSEDGCRTLFAEVRKASHAPGG